MYKAQAKEVKNWLKAYRAIGEQIDEKIDRLRMMRERMMSVSAQKLTDMPKGGGSGDPMADYVIRVENLELSIKHDVEIQEQCRKVIFDLTQELSKPEERRIIELRYLQGLEWSDVMNMLYRGDDKYAQKLDTYRRRMYRVHEEALEKMAKRWSKNGQKGLVSS